MPADILLHVLVGIAPVLCFLLALRYMDSYKLVSMRAVVTVVACGVAVALFCYVVNAYAVAATGIGRTAYGRYAAPLIEELAKALVIVALMQMHRIGFLIDAAIFGFAVGSGFAVVENIYYQRLLADAGLGIWIVRGFGTAIMHGGTTAIFAMMALVVRGTQRPAVGAFLPGLLLAVVLHSAFNHLLAWPKVATLAVLIALPPLLFWVFARSERSVGDWLGEGFDADVQMLEWINSGHFPHSPAGRYLSTLRHRFHGPVLADLLCYLRLHTELALRAKGILMMRESGFETQVDEETRAKFVELRYLERSMGKTGMLAIRPLLHRTDKDVWQLYMLGGA